MLKTKQIIFIAILCAIFFSCSEGKRKVVASYEDGKPFIVEYEKTVKGKKEKTYEEHYWQNGNKRLEGAFKNGKKNGVWKFYYEDGSLFAQTKFSDNMDNSSWKIFYNKDSLLVKENDKILNIAFSTEQTPVSIRIKRDKGEVFYRFFNSFKLMERVFLKGNIPQGEAMSWHENGNINSIHYYIDGLQDSTYTVYSEQGQTILSGKYKKGIKIGKWEYFTAEGKPLGYEIFDSNGTRLSINDNQGLRYNTKKNM